MPVKNCRSGDKPGKKYGNRGKCYTGPRATAKAKRQGRAIEASKHRKKK